MPQLERPRRQRRGSASGVRGDGRSVVPMRWRSTAAAHGPALGDGPDDEALAPAHVAGDEDAVDVGGPVGRRGRRCRGRRGRRRAARAGPSCSGADEAHGQEHQLALEARTRCPRPSRSVGPAVDDHGLDLVGRAARRRLPSSSPRNSHGARPSRPARRPPRGPRRCGRSSARSATGWPSGRSSGGRGMISNWWTDARRPGGGRCRGSRRRCRRRR